MYRFQRRLIFLKNNPQYGSQYQSESDEPPHILRSRVDPLSVFDPNDRSGKVFTVEDLFNSGVFDYIPPHVAEEIGDVPELDADLTDEDDFSDSTREPYKCLVCGRMATHKNCPYRKNLPHEVILPPSAQRVCKCCWARDGNGHSDLNWEGRAILKECSNCGTTGEHWTDEAACPHNAPQHQQASVPAIPKRLPASPAMDCTSPPFST